MKLVDILSLLEFKKDKYIIKFNDDVLAMPEDIDKHMYDTVIKIEPEHNSYCHKSYVLITLEPNIYWEYYNS